METRIAVIGIIVENPESVGKLNLILHEFSDYIISRMGLPYRQKQLNIISIVVDAPQDAISTMAGKIGNLDGVSAKAAYSKYTYRSDRPDDSGRSDQTKRLEF